MAKKEDVLKKIEMANSIEELVEIGHAVPQKDKDKKFNEAIYKKMNALLKDVK